MKTEGPPGDRWEKWERETGDRQSDKERKGVTPDRRPPLWRGSRTNDAALVIVGRFRSGPGETSPEVEDEERRGTESINHVRGTESIYHVHLVSPPVSGVE